MSHRSLMLTISLVAGGLAAACSPSIDLTDPPPGPTEPSIKVTATAPDSAPLGEPFHIGIDQPTPIEATDLTITFADIVEDSRCPEDVTCVWEGRVVVRLGVTSGTQDFGSYELTTVIGEDTATVGTDYVIQLLGVSPYPQTADKGIPLSDYTVTLMVSKSAAQ